MEGNEKRTFDFRTITAEEIATLTRDEIADLVLDEYVETHTKPDLRPVTQAELAKKYNRSQSSISRMILDSKAVERKFRRVKTSVMLAQIMAENASPLMMEKTIESALKKRDKKYEYINQGDRRDILDRAGVRAKTEEKQEIVLSFDGGMVDLGMPEGDR